MAEHNTDLNYGSFRNHQELMRAIGSRIQSKVDKVAGKGLSSNDYTDTEKTKLADLENYDDSDIRSEIAGLDEAKVDKITGKGLSSNDYTTAEKTKLANIENGAQTNVIENIEVNGSAQPINNKTVAITVMTNAVDDLINYYKKSETYTQEEVNNLIGLIPKFSIKVVESLPVTDISYTTVYLLKTSETETGNLYTEYIYVKVSEQVSQWEKLGTQTLDLSDYVTTTDLNNALANYTTTTALNSLLSGKVDKDGNKVLSTNDYTDADKALVADSPITVTATASPISTANGKPRKLKVYGKSEIVDGAIKSAGEGYAVVDLGTLNYISGSDGTYGRYYTTDLSNIIKRREGSLNLLCTLFISTTYLSDVVDSPHGYMWLSNTGNISFSKNGYADATAFKTAMSGVLLCYELADPSQGNTIAIKTDDGMGINGTMATFTTGTPLYGVSADIRDVMEWDGSAGEVTKNCGVENLDQRTWNIAGEADHTFYIGLQGVNQQSATVITNANYTQVYSIDELSVTDKSFLRRLNTTIILFRDTAYTEATDFKNSMSGKTLIYELATPTTEQLTQTENESLSGLKTYSPQTTITINDSPEFEVEAYANTANGQAAIDIQKELQEQIDEIKNVIKPRVYAFYVDQNDSNPATRVHPYYNTKYGCDNLLYINAYMDYDNDEFNYGSWEEFIKEFFKPCMLAYDGHVDYYLDPDDYETKLDGGTSDVKDMTYDGNVMVQIKKLWVKRWTTNGKYYCIISDKKLDKSFKAFAHHDIKGNVLEYIYRAAYDGSYDGTRLRSISGIDYHNVNTLTVDKIMSNTTRQEEINFAKANNNTNEKGEGWNILHKAEWDLINDLLLLIGMSTNTQATFGNGNISSYVSTSDTGIIATGTMDKKGLFYGKNDNVSGVKVFGIEMPWGNIWKSCLGWILSANQHLVKMTPGNEDGSTATDYNLDGTGYVATGKSITANGYISAFDSSDTGFLPTAASGSATTYMCDYVWQNTETYFALVGGCSVNGAQCGAFYSNLNNSTAVRHWGIGAALSYKGLANDKINK